MCRIAGFWDFSAQAAYPLEETIVSMRDSLTYGGPDDAGFFIDKARRLAFGHRRLSIIDLSSQGRQPMSVDDGDISITFNGEIYNFALIRRELEELGIRFRSASDTEVLLQAYREWGLDFIGRWRGMWAFALWNRRRQELILCRDRVGVKPLFWYFRGGLFIFGSELKAFHRHPGFRGEIEREALPFYFQYGYIPTPMSIFKNTYKLEPGYFLIVDRTGKIRKEKYWDIEDHFRRGAAERSRWLSRTDDEVADELEEILTEGFKLRMVSDVPVGIFLSGGVDSSLLAALLRNGNSTPLKTFTIGFREESHNEAVWARKVADHLGTEHTEFTCTPRDANFQGSSFLNTRLSSDHFPAPERIRRTPTVISSSGWENFSNPSP